MLVPGGMQTAFFDGRDEQFKPGPDARLNRPEDVAAGGGVRAAPARGLRGARDGGDPVRGAVLAVSAARPRLLVLRALGLATC